MRDLWTEKYRPTSIKEYIFTDERQRTIVESWISEGTIPHLLLSGSPGTGKTTLAKVLIKELGVNDMDFLHINASRDNGVDFIRERVEGFSSTMPYGDFRLILMDEADYLSINAQAIMRGLLETYQGNARFIFTCNMPHKIMDAIHSRCTSFHIEKSDVTEFTARAASVLLNESVEFDLDVLDNYVRATYPDLRKCLMSLQTNSGTGTLSMPDERDKAVVEWRIEAVKLLKAGKIREARQAICNQASAEDIDSMFRWCYDNLDLWSTDPEKQDRAIVIIRDSLVSHAVCADPEINLSAMLVKLTSL
jgi:DNA polymerase III delta prime subunit